jgi:tRNA(fMet)-specific endonuclease VapC
MLCFDTTLLADYLDGHDAAKDFLTDHEHDVWGTPSVALFEAYMGAVYGRPRGDIEDVYEATRGLEVLPVTDETARSAAQLQHDLKSNAGIELGFVDALLVATADENGARFATNDQTIRKEAVNTRVDVVEYER